MGHAFIHGFRTDVFDARLLDAATAKTLCRSELRPYFKDLAAWVTAEERVMVAWSQRELDVFREHAYPSDLRALEKAYRNGIRAAKDYRRRCESTELRCAQPVPAENSLGSWMRYFGYRVPHGQGAGLVAAAILDVRNGLEKRGRYENLTVVMKGKWTRALGHNHHDCLGMRHVVRRLTGLDG